jgi:ferric-dicitrate binding protein FerR (iron transport regulator)
MKQSNGVVMSYRAIALLLCVLLSPLPQFAQTASRAGSISALRPSAMRNTTLLKAKDQVNWNDTLKTDTGGRMRIGLDDGSILSVGTNSQLRIVKHDARAQQTQLELAYGRMRSQVVRLTNSGSQFEVRTPTAVAGVIGTDFFLEATPTGTKLIVYEGVVTLTPIIAGALVTAQAITVKAGYSATIDQNGVNGPNQTPSGSEEESISQTSIEGIATRAAVAAKGGHLLRNTLIFVGVAGAVTGGIIAAGNSSGGTTNQQIPPK